jgi:hypothetical protein
MASSKSLLDKLPQGRRIQETIQILKNESITVINQLLADVAADQRHGIVAAIGRTYPVICKLCS